MLRAGSEDGMRRLGERVKVADSSGTAVAGTVIALHPPSSGEYVTVLADDGRRGTFDAGEVRTG